MQYAFIVFGFLAGLFAANWIASYRQRRGHGYVLVWDGAAWRAYSGRRVAAGVIAHTADGAITYPWNAVTRVVLRASSGLCAYIVAAEPIPLANHESLEIGRHGIALSAMFKSGGDILRLLQIAAAVVPLAAAIWLTLSFSGVQNTLNANTADLKLMRDVLSRPLEVSNGK